MTAASARVVRPCTSCRAPIIWAVTVAGKAMPIDAEPDPDGNVLLYANGTCRTLNAEELARGVFLEHRHTSHFATCPNAGQHRRR